MFCCYLIKSSQGDKRIRELKGVMAQAFTANAAEDTDIKTRGIIKKIINNKKRI